MATGIIHAGVCGFTINVKAVIDDSQSNSRRSKMIKLEITSDCPNSQKISKELTEVDACLRLWVLKCTISIRLEMDSGIKHFM